MLMLATGAGTITEVTSSVAVASGMAGVVVLAINWVREIDENVKLQSVNVVRVWEGLKAAEGTFWEQSESIAEHIQALENIVARKLDAMETGELKAICQVIRAEQQAASAPIIDLVR